MRTVFERVMGLRLPGKADRRSRYLKNLATRFVRGDLPPHYSPSGMTAVLLAEAALEAGHVVRLEIHPRHGAVLLLGASRDSWWPEEDDKS